MIQPHEKILILGCGGMLGEGVYARFKDVAQVTATDIDVNEPWLSYLDVRDEAAVRAALEALKPDYVIHLAALTDMEECEQNPDNAYATNTRGVEHFIPYVTEHNIPFVYISTAGIFDGEKDVYDENDTPNPLSVYGKSKYAGELAARTAPKHVVARAGWMMGGGPQKDKKFINKIVRQITAGATDLYVVEDKLGTPCYTYDFANVLYTLLDQGHYGVYHGVCKGGESRYEIAKHLVSALGCADKVQVHKVGSDYFKTTYYAPRPRSEMLHNTRLTELNLDLTRDWKDALNEYVTKFPWLG